MKSGKKSGKYGKMHNISLKDFKAVKNTKRYKLEVEKNFAKATQDKTKMDEKTSAIASLPKSKVEKQVKFATGTKPGASTVASSDIEFKSALGSILKGKDKGK